MDLPLQHKRWKAIMTKNGKAKQAGVYLKITVLLSEKCGLGGVKDVADTLVDRGYRTNDRLFCNWEQAVHRWRYKFKNTHALATVNPKTQKAKSTTRSLSTAANNSNLESCTPACSLMRVSRREHVTIPWRPNGLQNMF